jgi:uncharacterized protein (TIGR02453 family)
MNKINLQSSSLEFLRRLKKNNHRDWFNKNKDWYLREREAIEKFADALLLLMNKHDTIETPSGKKCLHRIYRDIRFSKEKTPYKYNWSGSFKRATKARRGGYYFHIESGNSFVAGGFWAPEPADLKRMRDEISANHKQLLKILKGKPFIDTFGNLQGEKIRTSPKGFSSDDPAIDLIRFKQFLLIKKFTDKEVLSADFIVQANDTFKRMRPFFNYMSEALTTDLNGLSIL